MTLNRTAASLILAAALTAAIGCSQPDGSLSAAQTIDAGNSANSTRQAENNRAVSATAQAMIQATVEALPLPTATSSNRPDPTPIETSPYFSPTPGGTPASAVPITQAGADELAALLWNCLQRNPAALSVFLSAPDRGAGPILPPGRSSPPDDELRASFVRAYAGLAKDHPITEPLLLLADQLCR